MIKHKTEFVCQLCSETFKTPADLRHHMDSKHTVTHKFNCSTCFKHFFVQGDLENHIAQEHSGNNVQFLITEIDAGRTEVFDKNGRSMCPICFMTSTHRNSVERHIKHQHTQPHLEQHIDARKENGQDAIFTCKICKIRNQQYNLMLRHVKVHTNEFEIENHSREDESTLDNQIIINPEEEEGELVLGGNAEVDLVEQENQSGIDNYELLYGEEFQENLNQIDDDEFILRKIPNEDGMWPCHLCRYIGKNRRLLKNHGLYHKSNYRCAICSRYYPSKFHLQRHMNTHLGDMDDERGLPHDNDFTELDSIQIDDSNDIDIKEESIV